MNDYRTILNRIGTVLIIVGCVDLLLLFYAISYGNGYFACLNIAALLAGFCLHDNSPKAVKIITNFAVVAIVVFIGSALLEIWSIPLSYNYTRLRIQSIDFILEHLYIIVYLPLTLWVYKSLTKKVVFDIVEQSGVMISKYLWFISRRRTALIYSIVIISLIGALDFAMKDSDTNNEIIRRATAQLGTNYDYYVSHLSITWNSEQKFVNAIVLAYNNNEIKPIEINWTE